MSYKNLLTDKVDIYLLQEVNERLGYGITSDGNDVKYYYGDEPDYKDIPCYCALSNASITQEQPNAKIYEVLKIHFLIGTDVRLNAKVKFLGALYKLQNPRNIRNHHIEVTGIRDESL